jgi:type IV pilus assembly protein PilQ
MKSPFPRIAAWALVPGLALGGDPSPRITLNAAGEDLHTVLEAIAEQTGYNLVLPENANLKLRLSLRDVSLREALDGILVLNGFQYQVQGKTILVYGKENAEFVKSLSPMTPLQARVFDLRHVSVKCIKDTVEGMLSPRGKLRAISGYAGRSWERTQTFLGAEQGGTVPKAAAKDPEDERADRVVVVDEDARLDDIAALIAKIDVPRRQVYVSAVIFEMSLTEEEEIGLRWRISASLSPSSLPWNFPFGHNDLGQFSPRVSPSDSFYPGPGDRGMFPDVASNQFLFGRIDMSGSNLLIELKRLGAALNLISNPRLMVADQEEAVILVGERYPLLQSTVTDQGTVTETFDRYEPIGVQLRVVPNVLDDGEVSLLIEPQITSLGATVTGTTGLSYPRISTRRVESKISVGDGESVVIAGLVSDSDSRTIESVPFLSDIPILGRLFRYRSTSREKVDLVVIVTPYIDRVPDFDALDREFERAGVPVKAGRLLNSNAQAAKSSYSAAPRR